MLFHIDNGIITARVRLAAAQAFGAGIGGRRRLPIAPRAADASVPGVLARAAAWVLFVGEWLAWAAGATGVGPGSAAG